MQDIFNKIKIEFEETKEDFIYKTIYPYCEEIIEQKLSKERLRKLLLLGLDAERELERELESEGL